MSRTNRTPKRRRDWKPAWLKAFAEKGTVSAACEAVKIGRSTAYEARVDEDFARAWDEIEASTTDSMEREAFRRAVEGTEKPVFQGGHRVGGIREFSDTLLIFMLKARRPHVYRENSRVELVGADGGPVRLAAPEDDVDRSARAASLLARAGQVGETTANGANGSNGHH